jgi:hypothetical protein
MEALPPYSPQEIEDEWPELSPRARIVRYREGNKENIATEPTTTTQYGLQGRNSPIIA